MHRAYPLLLLLWGFSAAAFAPDGASLDVAPRPVLPESLHWTGMPNAPAIQGAWVVGSEQAPGAYVLRVRISANGRIPPHAHPDAHSSTVLSGTLYVGFGESFDESMVVAVPIAFR